MHQCNRCGGILAYSYEEDYYDEDLGECIIQTWQCVDCNHREGVIVWDQESKFEENDFR